MKKQGLLVLAIFLLTAFQSFGQTTLNYIPKFSNSSGTIHNSVIYQKGSDIGIGDVNPEARLHIGQGINGTNDSPGLKISTSYLNFFDITTGQFSVPMSGKAYINFETKKPSESNDVSIVASIGLHKGFNSISSSGIIFFAFTDPTTSQMETKMAITNSGEVIIGDGGSSNSRLQVNSTSGQNAFIAQVNGSSKLTVNSNGSVSVGAATTGPANGMYVNGNVNIGTTASSSRLQVNSTSGQNAFIAQVNGSNKFMVNSNGSVSVGAATTGPANGMYVNGNVNIGTTSSSSRLQVNSASGQAAFTAQVNGSTKLSVNSNGSVSVGSTSSGPANGMYISGSVGIGTTGTHDYKLAIAGKMIAEEVVVKLQANWPDYVFDESYELKSLAEVEQFIKEHKHLPNIPSAKEVEENGISVGKINTVLMEKVEELTLYILQLNQTIDSQNERIKILENSNR